MKAKVSVGGKEDLRGEGNSKLCLMLAAKKKKLTLSLEQHVVLNK